MTAEGFLVGTAGFLAPEVIEERPAGPASDRYALAAVAFEALTGRPPFEADGAPGLLRPRQPPRAAGLVAPAPAWRRASTPPSEGPREGPP